MGYLQIINMLTDGIVVPIDILIDNTPIIQIHCEAEVLSQEMSEVLPEQ